MNIWRAADRGDIVLGWLTKVIVVLAILGVVGFDGIALLHTRVSAADTADHAAVEARDTWQETKNAEMAYAAAVATAKAGGATIPVNGVVIKGDGTVLVEVHQTAHTFLLRHVSRLKSVANVTGHGRAQPPA